MTSQTAESMQARADRIASRPMPGQDATPGVDWLAIGLLALVAAAHVGALVVMYVMARAS